MHILHKILLNCIVFGTFLFVIYTFQTPQNILNDSYKTNFIKFTNEKSSSVINVNKTTIIKENTSTTKIVNIWCIFTKVSPNSPIKNKFYIFISSLLQYSTLKVNLNIIIDKKSNVIADQIIESVNSHKLNKVIYHQVNEISLQIRDIITTLRPHFSSQPGSYYSDALFYVSLGIHRIALDQDKAIMLDIDTKIQCDILELYQQFDNFQETALFGLAPELSPVYRHVLYLYRIKNKDTLFGEANGFPGFNSGVILLWLDRIRNSELFSQLLQEESVKQIIKKYSFKGHLGDQDWYTLLGMEKPELIYHLSCGFNRQLCRWWSFHGYEDVFPKYFLCNQPIKIYHGNCNTTIPSS